MCLSSISITTIISFNFPPWECFHHTIYNLSKFIKYFITPLKSAHSAEQNNPLTLNLADIHHKLIEQVMTLQGQGKKNKETKTHAQKA